MSPESLANVNHNPYLTGKLKYSNSIDVPSSSSPSGTTSNNNNSGGGGGGGIKAHADKTDCWICISNTVYDVTEYKHSGPQNKITDLCGKDATSAIKNKHGLKYVKQLSDFKLKDAC